MFLTLLMLLPNHSYAISRHDSLVVNRVFDYQRNFTSEIRAFSTNVYTKHLYTTNRRNVTLLAVPSMFNTLARGRREFISEEYGKLVFDGTGNFHHYRQVYYTTIPHQRRTMPTLLEFLTPNLYGSTMYGDHILSPFNRENKKFYHYIVTDLGNGKCRFYYRPRFTENTQLVSGVATVDYRTGRIEQAQIRGEFDMIKFETLTMQGNYGMRSLLPTYCHTNARFSFLGNDISSDFEAYFDCPVTLADSMSVRGERGMMDSIRPVALSDDELRIYRRSIKARHAVVTDTTNANAATDEEKSVKQESRKSARGISWEQIGKTLVGSLRTRTERAQVKLSPIINPQYLGYSQRKGLSYKFKLGAMLKTGDNQSLRFNPRVGYNFKLHQLYTTTPLTYHYNESKNNYAMLDWETGYLVSSSTVVDEIMERYGLESLDGYHDVDMFHHNRLRAFGSHRISQAVRIEAGLVYHEWKSAERRTLMHFGQQTEYRSLAQMLGLKLRPWSHGPLFSIDYERSFKSDEHSLDYERWEVDASLKHRLTRLRTLNLRAGGGFYSRRVGSHFMDFSNFRDENLPEGWDDDWSGNFQLLRSRFYNTSDYYLRANISYESPLLMMSMLPAIGRFVEQERIYWSGLIISDTRPYSEIGYGLTCRAFSVGLFASFSGIFDFQSPQSALGCKFTYELFRRW